MQGWDAFYQVTGEGAATLTGLLFLAATLTSGRDPEALRRGMKLFSTPVVVKFISVILASALALAPAPFDGLSVGGLAIVGGGGAVYAALNSWGLHRSDNVPHWTDYWCYGLLPVPIYLALGVSGFASAARWPWGPPAAAASVLAMLVLAIRNAWDLITWLAPRRNEL